jgi:hypothetical protein
MEFKDFVFSAQNPAKHVPDQQRIAWSVTMPIILPLCVNVPNHQNFSLHGVMFNMS